VSSPQLLLHSRKLGKGRRTSFDLLLDNSEMLYGLVQESDGGVGEMTDFMYCTLAKGKSSPCSVHASNIPSSSEMPLQKLRPPCLQINPPIACSSIPRRYLHGPRNTVPKPPQPSRIPTPSERQGRNVNAVSEAPYPTENRDNSLLCPVHIPEDPNGVLRESHPAAGILANSAIVIQRQLELMNVMMYAAEGFCVY
jgi:hypothetical protein